MIPSEFCYWLNGYSELCEVKPSKNKWLKIKKKFKEINFEHLKNDQFGFTPDSFCTWLSGFIEINKKKPNKKQWLQIKEHLNLVFIKETKSWDDFFINPSNTLTPPKKSDDLIPNYSPFQKNTYPPLKNRPETAPILLC